MQNCAMTMNIYLRQNVFEIKKKKKFSDTKKNDGKCSSGTQQAATQRITSNL